MRDRIRGRVRVRVRVRVRARVKARGRVRPREAHPTVVEAASAASAVLIFSVGSPG